MNRRTFVQSIALLTCLPLAAGLAGCASTKKAGGLRQVDDLLGRIERVHLETELARERAKVVMQELTQVLAPEIQADSVLVFAEFSKALQASEDQAYRLRSAIGPMKEAADAMFQRWGTDLAGFASAEMRRRSQVRLDETRARYEEIVSSAGPAQSTYEVLNVGLRDLALFLGHDLNVTAVSSVQRDVQSIAEQAMKLDQCLKRTLVACRDYVRAAAPQGQVEIQSNSAATQPKSETKSSPKR